MDRALPAEEPPPAGGTLADEMRHSALLLGWTLGLMSTVAVVLLVLTTRFGG